MPTYDYRCDGCGHEFEHFQGISDPVLRKCPSCSARKLKRLIGTGAGLIFKGSGFYITDYRSDSYKRGAEKENGSKAPEGKSAEGSSKPSAKKTGKTGKTGKAGKKKAG
jgi:putative FmdB family regulatory protein